METRIQEVEERMDEIETRVTDLEESEKSPEELDGRVVALETRIKSLETIIRGLREALDGKTRKPRKTRAKREYSDEERATIRARLVAGKKKKAEERARLAEEAGGEDE